MCAAGIIEPLVASDLDLANMFGTIEWPDVRDAVREDFAESMGWINFQHRSPETVQQQNGDEHDCNRGAGQGNVFGSATSSLVQGHFMQQDRVSQPTMRLERLAETMYPTVTTERALELWKADQAHAWRNRMEASQAESNANRAPVSGPSAPSSGDPPGGSATEEARHPVGARFQGGTDPGAAATGAPLTDNDVAMGSSDRDRQAEGATRTAGAR